MLNIFFQKGSYDRCCVAMKTFSELAGVGLPSLPLEVGNCIYPSDMQACKEYATKNFPRLAALWDDKLLLFAHNNKHLKIDLGKDATKKASLPTPQKGSFSIE